MRPIKEIEYSFFGCLFDNAPNSVLEAIELRCKKEWFTLPECQLVWTAIENINREGDIEHFSLPVVWQEVTRLTRKKKTEFSGIQFNASQFYEDAVRFRQEDTQDTVALAEILRNGMIGRATKEIAQKDLMGLDTEKDASSVVTSFIGKLTSLINDEAVEDEISTENLVDSAMQDWNTAYQEYAVNKNFDYSGPGFQTPWQKMNKAIGNFQVGLNIIAARPSVGKTSFALQLMNYWCQCGYKCAFNCLDMACKEIIKRPTVSLAQLNLSRAQLGMLTQDEYERIKAAANLIREWGRKGVLRFRTDYDVDKFIAWCKLQKSLGKLDIVVIDYVQQLNVRGFDSSSNENLKLQEISKRLKAFALTQQVPVILLAQLNRDTVKGKEGPREPEISDIRGSGALEQDAYTITLLHRDDDCQAELRKGTGDIGLKLTPDGADPKATLHTLQSLDAIWVLRKKSQNGAGGRFPMVVYNSSFQWFLGDYDAPKADKPFPVNMNKFSRITADYRFNQEPFLTAERNGVAIFPDYWERTAERICKKMNWEIPDSLQQKIERYNAEHTRQTDIEYGQGQPADSAAYQVAKQQASGNYDYGQSPEDDLSDIPF